MNTFRTQSHKINPTKSTKIIIRHNLVLVSTSTNSMRWSHTSECIKCKVAEVLYVSLQIFLLTASQTILIYRQKIWKLKVISQLGEHFNWKDGQTTNDKLSLMLLLQTMPFCITSNWIKTLLNFTLENGRPHNQILDAKTPRKNSIERSWSRVSWATNSKFLDHSGTSKT